MQNRNVSSMRMRHFISLHVQISLKSKSSICCRSMKTLKQWLGHSVIDIWSITDQELTTVFLSEGRHCHDLQAAINDFLRLPRFCL